MTTTAAYCDTTLPIATRVDDLIGRMTLEEKVSQMAYDSPAIERLGIPKYNWWNEVLHGVARAGVATVFPQAIGLAATWDTSLIAEIATVISDEARAKHHEFARQGYREIYAGLTAWSPNVNLFRDPRWGRGQETYGEDPYLTSRVSVTFVRGLQGEDDPRRPEGRLKLVATPKHLAVHSGPEISRHEFNAVVSERDLRETYLRAFEACVKEGRAASVMGAYNRVNGEAACASPTLLTKIVRGEWGFDGLIVSDCFALNDVFGGHGLVETAAEASALAVRAGCDLECGCAFGSLLEAVETGLLTEADIDCAVRRVFAARFAVGMFDGPERNPYAQVPHEVNDCAAHRALSRRAAAESVVLLKNAAVDGRPLLPLDRTLKSIAVIGPVADSLDVLLGNYCGTPSRAVTPLEGIRRKVSPATAVYTAQGCEIAEGAPSLLPIPAACLRPPADTPGAPAFGLLGTYARGTGGSTGEAPLKRLDHMVDFSWRDASPWGGPVFEHFSACWEGSLVAPVSGTYSLGARASSGCRLLLDGCELLPYQTDEHYAKTRTVPVELVAGRLYDLRLEYVNEGRSPEAQLLWARHGEDYMPVALEAAQLAEVVVLVLGLSPEVEGEEMPVRIPGFEAGDRTDISLPAPQEALLRRVVELGKPVVLVLVGGSAIAVNWAAEHVPAILHAWYGGEEGGSGLADVLFGDANPAGRLPVTVHKSVDQLPPFEDYAMAGRTYRFMTAEPLYPFGHGLSYTHFEYGNLRVTPDHIDAGGRATICATITNTGERGGDEVVQLYVRYPHSAVERPLRELKGFARITLAPGESQDVTFELPASELAYWGGGTWVVEPAEVELLVSASSQDARLTGRLTVCREVQG